MDWLILSSHSTVHTYMLSTCHSVIVQCRMVRKTHFALMILHSSLVYSVIPFIVFRSGMSLKRPKKDNDKKVMNVTQRRTWRICRSVFTVWWCACAILMCDSVYVCVRMRTFSHVNIRVISRWPVCLCMFALPRVYMKVRVYECDSVCEPVGSLPVVCSWRCAYGETETSSGAPLPLLWWKAALIEWPGTQPPFLINSCSIAFNYS